MRAFRSLFWTDSVEYDRVSRKGSPLFAMIHSKDVLLEAWRQVACHAATGGSVSAIAAILARETPLERIVIRRATQDAPFLETISVELGSRVPTQMTTRTQCSEIQVNRLLAWCRRGELMRRRDESPPSADSSDSNGSEGARDQLVGPLACDGHPVGLATFIASTGKGFSRRETAVLRQFLEPLAVAIGNGSGAGGSPVSGQGGEAPPATSLNEAMRRHICAALRRTRGRVEGPRGAALALGINPHTLRARMRKLGIDWARYR
jgi:hypothetical protein